jgi:uncharacterized membrane protein
VAQSIADKVATFAAGDPDWQIADVLNAPDAAVNGTKTVDAAVSDARAILMTSGGWGKIVLIAEGALSPVSDPQQALGLRALCITVRDAHLNLTSLKMTDPVTAAAINDMVDSLLGATLIDRKTHDALLALGTVPASWADMNNASVPVTARDVGLARGAVA